MLQDIRNLIEARKSMYMTNWNFSKQMYLNLFEVMDMAAEKDIFINDIVKYSYISF